jgi:NTP pyrophosphatase (non-canonical NTP hydrolase)
MRVWDKALIFSFWISILDEIYYVMGMTKNLLKELNDFRDNRDWSQFHNPKDLALAISIEANELLAEFLWKGHEEANHSKVKSELADVMTFCLFLCDRNGWDPEKIILEKLEENKKKYPVEKAKGTAKKYTDLK